MRPNQLIGREVSAHLNLVLSRPGAPIYSVASGGRIVARVPALRLADARFIVSQAGRERAMRERRRNVHAWVRGTVVSLATTHGGLRPVRYNPYRAGAFTRRGRPIWSAPIVVLAEGCAWA